MLSLFLLLCFITVNHSQEAFDPTAHENWPLLKNRNCEDNPTSRIVGGTNARLGEFPWIARLVRSGFANCGGSIVNERTIVTGAHCVNGTYKQGIEKKPDLVVLGEWNKYNDPDCDGNVCAEKIQEIKPIEIIIHGDFVNNPERHDIALIRLAEDIQFNSYVWPICLPKGHLMQKNLIGIDAIAAGWGIKDTSTKERSTILHKVTLRVRNNDLCKKFSSQFYDEDQICAGGDREDTGVCNGDSGGPLMIVDEIYGRPRTFLIGIASQILSEKCGALDVPSAFTRVTAFMSWILDNLAENKNNFKKL